ncbi:hypothetical protein CYY_004198 [Polysphondylium violaceum]|uniref:Non-structural maintenance of chromosomes element 4 n=1 Tax=Polysphondylium violaceum TaxID=133409 RepID=A0A8J4PTN9_9MYCE|nr:hypothetical protein CYY_004198 [Polysphondylium violaceum]
MYGPLDLEKKKRQRKKKEEDKSDRQPIGNIVEAEKVLNNQTIQESTFSSVQVLLSYLREKEKANFLDTIIDKNSFAQSIENVFYLSFLLKDGHIAMITDEQGQLTLMPSSPPDEGITTNVNYSLFKLDYEIWKNLAGIVSQDFNMEQEMEDQRLKFNSQTSVAKRKR